MQEGAATPERLMRSRYTAFVMSNVEYLIQTTHSALLSRGMRNELKEACRENQWLSLRVIDTEDVSEIEGYVEFVAYARQGEVTVELHERSRFFKVKERWLYHSGVVLPHFKIRPNEPCWCGSGKKLKNCHRV